MLCLQHNRLSHSEICGSMVICTSPQLIAAYHVLHRLREPRHPPYALSCFFLCRVHIHGRVFHTFSCTSRLFLYDTGSRLFFTVYFVPICQRSSRIRLRKSFGFASSPLHRDPISGE